MSDELPIIDVLAIQIDQLILKIRDLEIQNIDLRQKVLSIKKSEQAYKSDLEILRNKHNALKSASSFLGSEENKKETKLKINSLVREIDYCIAQLST